MTDMVNKPPHYQARNGMESMDWLLTSMTEAEKRGYLKGNVLKYLWRYEHKGKPVEDLKKAEWYISRLIKVVEEKEENKIAENVGKIMYGFYENHQSMPAK